MANSLLNLHGALAAYDTRPKLRQQAINIHWLLIILVHLSISQSLSLSVELSAVVAINAVCY